MPDVSESLGIDLRRLELLADVDALGTIAATGSKRNLTASAVSQQLQALAREVGQPLLERVGRRVHLTPQGRVMLTLLRDLEHRVEAARVAIAGATGDAVSTVRVASFTSGITNLVAPAIAILAGGASHAQVEIAESNPRAAIAAVADGRADIGLCVDFPGAPSTDDARFVRTDLVDDVLDLAVPARHPLAAKTSVTLSDLIDEVWIAPPESEPCDHILNGLCATVGFTPRIRHRCAEWDAVLAIVGSGGGVSLVPRFAQPIHRPDVTVLQLSNPHAARRVFALRRADAFSAALDAVQGALRCAATSFAERAAVPAPEVSR